MLRNKTLNDDVQLVRPESSFLHIYLNGFYVVILNTLITHVKSSIMLLVNKVRNNLRFLCVVTLD